MLRLAAEPAIDPNPAVRARWPRELRAIEAFKIIFTLSMIGFPAVFTLFARPGRDLEEGGRARAARLGRWLWVATLTAAGVYLVLYFRWPAVSDFLWMTFFALWFGLAMPLLRARHPASGAAERGAVRTASPVRRDRLPPELRVGWAVITALWALLFSVAALGLLVSARQPPSLWLLAFNLAAGVELWIFHQAMRRSPIEAETVSADDGPALRAAREKFRRFRLNGWFALAALVMPIFSLPPLLLIWYGDSALSWAIAIGAGGGTLAGIGGGVFGTMASLQRARIRRYHPEGETGG